MGHLRPAALALLALALAPACGSETEYRDTGALLRSFKVEVAGRVELGDPEEPLPFPSGIPARVPLVVQALDAFGSRLASYDGVARITVAPGNVLRNDQRVKFEDGLARVEAVFRFSFGPTRIWVEDIGEDPLADCKDGLDNDGDRVSDDDDPDCLAGAKDDAARATRATGISTSLYFAEPRIRDLQFAPRCSTDTPLGGQNVTIDDGTLIVTGTSQSGLYVTDLSGSDGGYNSVYLFTFSSPAGVVEGDRLCNIAGNAAEFIGNTQLNFPSFLNADERRLITVDGQALVPCTVSQPDRVGPDALPEPHVLTAADVLGVDAEGAPVPAPDDFYRTCGIGDTVIEGLDDPTDCQAARNLIPADVRRQSKIDCARDNFAMEPWEHALVAFEDVTVSTRFEVCDVNDDGRIDRAAGNPEGECEKDCTSDPLCTVTLSLEQFGQVSAGIGCSGEGDLQACEGTIYIATRDTLGKSGFDAVESAGRKFDRVIGHLRQTQPGAGVPSIWIVEPRKAADFVEPRGAAE